MEVKYPELFKKLSPAEEKKYRKYAEKHDPPELAQWELYHPVCREVWLARGIDGTGVTLADGEKEKGTG